MKSRNRKPNGNIVISHPVFLLRLFLRRLFPLRRYFLFYPAARARTSNRKGDDGFSKIGSYFFFLSRKSQSAKDGGRLSNSKEGGLNEEGGREGQSSQNTHSGFGNEAISLPATLRTFTLVAPAPPFAPSFRPTSHTHVLPPPFASNRRARRNFFGRGREKGIFLEITTGVLREDSSRKRMRERERERERNKKKERETSKRRNRPTSKKARRSPLAPPSTAYKGEEKRATRRRPSYRAEGRENA